VELATNGFDIAIHFGGSSEGAEASAAACREAGADAWTVQADLADPEQIARMVDTVSDRWDRLDVLVNNASLFEPMPFEDIDVATWDRMAAVNVRAPFLLSRGLLGLLREAEGLVVHMCDIGADRPLSGYAHYSASKAGLVMLVKAMAVELAPVRSVGISPGQVAWPADYPEEKRKRLARRIPLGRTGVPSDIARLVRFLALEGTYINGEIIAVDGGLSKRY
jgi:pteridine reductase